MRNSALAALLGRQNSNSLVHQQAVQPSASREEALTAQAPRVSLQPPVWKRLFDISRFSLKKIQEETPGTSTEKTVFRSDEPFTDTFQAKMPKATAIQDLVVLKKVSLSRQKSLAKHFVKKKDWNFSKVFPEGSTTEQAIKKFRKVVNQIVSGSK